jgi:hypothetical protein
MNYEEAAEVNSSGVWTNVCKVLDEWIAAELNKLKSCNIEQVASIQQTIRDFEKVKNLPSIVKDSIE